MASITRSERAKNMTQPRHDNLWSWGKIRRGWTMCRAEHLKAHLSNIRESGLKDVIISLMHGITHWSRRTSWTNTDPTTMSWDFEPYNTEKMRMTRKILSTSETMERFYKCNRCGDIWEPINCPQPLSAGEHVSILRLQRINAGISIHNNASKVASSQAIDVVWNPFLGVGERYTKIVELWSTVLVIIDQEIYKDPRASTLLFHSYLMVVHINWLEVLLMTACCAPIAKHRRPTLE